MDFWMVTACTNKDFLGGLHFPKVLFITPHSRFVKVGNSHSCCLLDHVLASPGGVLARSTREVRRWGGHTAASRRFRVPQTTSRVSGDSCFLSRTGDVGDKSGK